MLEENSFIRKSSLINKVLETVVSKDVYSYRLTLEKEIGVCEETLCL
ncbi:MAG: hypothetical protein ACUVQ0_07040 [Thermoproteota archaeon]